MKYLESMANTLNMDYDTFIKGLIAIGILNQNGTPKKKWKDAGYFNDDGTIKDYPALKNLICQLLGI